MHYARKAVVERAAILAKAQSITPAFLKASKLEGLGKQFEATKIPPMDDSDYSRLIVINTTAAPANLITLRYGH